MSYSDPAPFASLISLAENMKSSAEVLKSHPEGAAAFKAWMEGVEFSERYGTRYKDLSGDVPEALVLCEDYFSLHEGKLVCESGHASFVWQNGGWANEDDLDGSDPS